MIDPRISNEDVYAGWITNDDRRAYERYLDNSHKAEVVYDTSKLVTDVQGTISSIHSLAVIEGGVNFISILASDDLNKIGPEVKEVVSLINGSHDSFTAIESIENNLKEQALKEGCTINGINSCAESGRSALSLVLGFASSGFASLTAGILAETVKLHIDFGKKLLDRAHWAALIRTYHGRISTRLMRNWGML